MRTKPKQEEARGARAEREEHGAGVRAHLLVTQAEGFLAPVTVKLQDPDQVTDRSDDRQAQNRLDASPRFQAGTFGKSLVLENVNVF